MSSRRPLRGATVTSEDLPRIRRLQKSTRCVEMANDLPWWGEEDPEEPLAGFWGLTPGSCWDRNRGTAGGEARGKGTAEKGKKKTPQGNSQGSLAEAFADLDRLLRKFEP